MKKDQSNYTEEDWLIFQEGKREGQVEIIDQLLELLPTTDIEGLLKDWKKTLSQK